jgi:hypothetical protein
MEDMHEDIKAFQGKVSRNFRKLQDQDGLFYSNPWITWIPAFSTPYSQMKDEIIGFANTTSGYADTIKEMEQTRMLLSVRFDRVMAIWSKLCTVKVKRRIWIFKWKETIRSNAPNSTCNQDIKEMETVIKQEIVDGLDRLKTWANASLSSYQQLLLQYSGIVRAIRRLKTEATTSTFTDYEAYLALYTDIHNRVLQAMRTLTEALDRTEVGKKSKVWDREV